MARAAVLERLTRITWRIATVSEVIEETPAARTLVLDVPGWPGHRAGQHVDLRLTADDGYQAQRSYSIASAPELDAVELTVERLDDGEVSPYLTEEVRAGDELELRGPIGGHFTWSADDDGGPLLLVAGGSGMVPLMAMLRHRAARASRVETHVLVSARTPQDALYEAELAALDPAGLHLARTYTRGGPPGWTGWTRRVDAPMLAEVGPAPAAAPLVFTCGPTAFVERVTSLLVDAGHDPRRIHAERFGPTGG